MATKREKRDPYFWEALISIIGLIVFISLAIVRYETDAHVPILLGVLVAALTALAVVALPQLLRAEGLSQDDVICQVTATCCPGRCRRCSTCSRASARPRARAACPPGRPPIPAHRHAPYYVVLAAPCWLAGIARRLARTAGCIIRGVLSGRCIGFRGWPRRFATARSACSRR